MTVVRIARWRSRDLSQVDLLFALRAFGASSGPDTAMVSPPALITFALPLTGGDKLHAALVAGLPNRRQQFFDYLRDSVAVRSALVPIRLMPCDAVVWKDDRMLHGRNAFVADRPGERFLVEVRGRRRSLRTVRLAPRSIKHVAVSPLAFGSMRLDERPLGHARGSDC